MRQILNIEQVAFKLNRSPSYIYHNRRRLEASGFPKPLEILGGGYDEAAIDLWLDRQIENKDNLPTVERESTEAFRRINNRISRLFPSLEQKEV
ncbi:MAG: hypothetical protein J5781_00195 [Clostridia bacterium]|nr:hypothetical protein [Clostridia bacterium]